LSSSSVFRFPNCRTDNTAVIPANAGIQATRLLRFNPQSEIRNPQSVARIFATRSVRFEPVFGPFLAACELAKWLKNKQYSFIKQDQIF
jgi:hypothetical protein